MSSVIMPRRTELFMPAFIGLLVTKFALHLTAILNGYGLHRDEYLYLAEGAHPMLGYMEGPPMIGWVAGLSQLLFGATDWAAKVPPLLVGLGSIYLLILLVREFGGGKMAQLIAGVAWVLSPAFLGSNNLFQPVSFNQFCWLLIALGWVWMVKYERPKDWYFLGVAVGLALLTKYSVVFYLIGLFGSMLFTPQRKLFLSKHCWRAAGIALLLFLPNLWWQVSHDFPVLTHMRELAETQLVNMTVADFLIPQFLFHMVGLLVWLPGLWYLLRSERLRPFRALGVGFVLLLLVLLLLSGKSYYTFGAYSALLAAGGCFWEAKLGKKSALLVPALLLNFFVIPFGLPVLSVETMRDYGVHMRDNYGLSAPLRWEDGSIRDLGQDYSDMHGWEEMVRTVAGFYHSLPETEQARTMIYAGNYGQAGALSFYRKKYDLPEPMSWHASYLLWVPEEVRFDRQIAIEDTPQNGSRYFAKQQLVSDTQWPNAREINYIYYYTRPTEDVEAVWRRIAREQRADRIGR